MAPVVDCAVYCSRLDRSSYVGIRGFGIDPPRVDVQRTVPRPHPWHWLVATGPSRGSSKTSGGFAPRESLPRGQGILITAAVLFFHTSACCSLMASRYGSPAAKSPSPTVNPPLRSPRVRLLLNRYLGSWSHSGRRTTCGARAKTMKVRRIGLG